MHKTAQRFFLFTLLAFTISACAGVKHPYLAADPQLPLLPVGSVALAVEDARPYIINEDKPSSFVGVTRTGTNVYDAYTASGKPFARDVYLVIERALREKGLNVHQADKASLANGGFAGEKGLKVTINDWKSDTAIKTDLTYNLLLEVVSPTGRTISESRISGKEYLGTNVAIPTNVPKEKAPIVLARKLEELFESSQVNKALQQQ